MPQLSTQQQSLVLDHLRSNLLCVVSTVDITKTQPESALVSFVEQDDLTLYISTRVTTRKYANLKKNPKVALVIGWELSNKRTLQYEGKASEMTHATEVAGIKQLFREKDSPAQGFLDNPETRFFQITPTWIRYSDYGEHPPVMFETAVK